MAVCMVTAQLYRLYTGRPHFFCFYDFGTLLDEVLWVVGLLLWLWGLRLWSLRFQRLKLSVCCRPWHGAVGRCLPLHSVIVMPALNVVVLGKH
jgi:hypothetical protein